MRFVLLCGAAAALAQPTARPVPTPPVAMPAQLEASAKARAEAAPASAAAKATLLAMLDHPAYRQYVGTMAPALAHWSKEESLAALEAEWEVTEIVHNWEPFHAFFTDVTLNSSIGYPYYFNVWQLQALGFVKSAKGSIEYVAEGGIFHLRNMTDYKNPTFDEASSRLMYGAMNVLKLSHGNTFFGGVSLVLNSSYIKPHTSVAAVDTGLWENCCNPAVPKFQPDLYANCSAWKGGPLGTLDHYYHSVVGHMWTWNETHAGPTPGANNGTYAYHNLAAMMSRMVGGWGVPVPPTFRGYPEANPLMNVFYKGGVKLVVLNAADKLFGRPEGQMLRDWAVSNDWVLAWAAVLNGESVDEQWGRLLDPYVLEKVSAGRNMTADPRWREASADFEATWQQTAEESRSIPASDLPTFLFGVWKEMWTVFEPSVLHMLPLARNTCADSTCAGVRALDQACVCS